MPSPLSRRSRPIHCWWRVMVGEKRDEQICQNSRPSPRRIHRVPVSWIPIMSHFRVNSGNEEWGIDIPSLDSVTLPNAFSFKNGVMMQGSTLRYASSWIGVGAFARLFSSWCFWIIAMMKVLCFLNNHCCISDQSVHWSEILCNADAMLIAICSRKGTVGREVKWRAISRFHISRVNPIASRNTFDWKKWMNRKESDMISRAACYSHRRALSREAGLHMQLLRIHLTERSLLNPFSKTLHAMHSILRDVESSLILYIARRWSKTQERHLWKKQGCIKDKTIDT